jgi:SAM-dependent methyltransferase
MNMSASEFNRDLQCPICDSRFFRIERRGRVYLFLRCKDCGVHYVDPLESLIAPSVLFDKYPWTQQFSANYESYLVFAMNSLEKKLQICETLTGFRPRSMIDVGCGNGLYVHAAKLLGLKALGTEVDAGSAAVASAHGLSVQIGKLEDIALSEQFDFAHIRMIVYLCPRPLSLLRCARDKVLDGGVVYVDTSHQDGVFSRLRRTFQKNEERYGQLIPPIHCISYTKRSFKKLLDRAGLYPRRFFTYSAGDRIYYPRLGRSMKDRATHCLKAGADNVGMGAFLAAYCIKIGDER